MNPVMNRQINPPPPFMCFLSFLNQKTKERLKKVSLCYRGTYQFQNKPETHHSTTIQVMCDSYITPVPLLQLWNIPDGQIFRCYILLLISYNPLSVTHTINQSSYVILTISQSQNRCVLCIS